MHKRRAGVIASVAVAVVATAGVVWIVRTAAADTSDAGQAADTAASRSGALASTFVPSTTVSVPPLSPASGVTPSTPEADPTTSAGGSSGAGSSIGATGRAGAFPAGGSSGEGQGAAKKSAVQSTAGSSPSTSSTALSSSTAHTSAAASTPTPPRLTTKKTTPTSAAPPAGTTTSRSSYPDSITPKAASANAVTAAVKNAVAEAADEGITQSVVILDRKTGRTVLSIDADDQMPAVSIAKLIFAADWMDNAGGGANLSAAELSDFDTMISTSDDDIASDYYGYNGEGAIVERVADAYGLSGTEPYEKNQRYWGGIEITAGDIASLLRQVLSDPKDGPYLSAAMRDSTHDGADGFDQEFGMNAVAGAGSKQGWGCCLGGVVAIHTAGFTANQIVVVLSASYPDASGINVPQVSAFENDPGFVAAVKASTRTARAAVDPNG